MEDDLRFKTTAEKEKRLEWIIRKPKKTRNQANGFRSIKISDEIASVIRLKTLLNRWEKAETAITTKHQEPRKPPTQNPKQSTETTNTRGGSSINTTLEKRVRWDLNPGLSA